MKKILLQLDSDRTASVFDAITAYDAGADVLLQYGSVEPVEVRALVYGAMFTRGGDDLKNSAVFVGGADVAKGEAMLKEVCGAFFGPVRVSVMLDANGCNTTATAAVVKLLSAGALGGKKVVVLAGTGPVGRRAAGAPRQGGRGRGRGRDLCPRRLWSGRRPPAPPSRSASACRSPPPRPPTSTPRSACSRGRTRSCAPAPPGCQLIPETIWRDHPTLRVLGDVNAVPPLGLEGTKATWDGKDIDGKIVFGALGIGDLKMKVHRRSVARLFEQNDLVLDAEEIFALAKELAEVVRVLVLGVSTRAMVESAVRGGHDVVAVDFFGDRDQARLAESYALRRDLGLPATAEGLAAAAGRIDADAVVYGSNLENHPEVVGELAGTSAAAGQPG